MSALLQRFGKEKDWVLLNNSANLGFVASVNRGMTFSPDRDVVLLNSDTVVPPGWVQRLHDCAYSAADIGTVTPFSNNATICSYPRFCASNVLPKGLSVKALDRLFQAVNTGLQIEIPTGVGFCMLIRRDCLDAVGLLNEEHFGKGYGEENDFCMRASAKGWRHLLCGDTFVYHAGAVSFGGEQKARVERAFETLSQLHPTYPVKVQRHICGDPARRLRHRVDLSRLHATRRPKILLVSHDLGGGVLRHVQELAAMYSDDAEFLLLRPANGGQHEISWMRNGEAMCLFFHRRRDWDSVQELFGALGLSRIHFHHSLNLPTEVWELPGVLGVPYDVTIHDYYSICPRINLVDHSGGYCQEPEDSVCNECLKATPGVENDVGKWREDWRGRLEHAARVLAPSYDVANRINRYFPRVRIVVAPHLDAAAPLTLPIREIVREEEPLKIVAIGALSQIKGGGLLEACARDAAQRRLPLRFRLIGYAWKRLSAADGYLVVTGKYEESELSALIESTAGHIAWFPSLWPETYSYTLSAALNAGLPVVVTDLGAPAERVTGREWSWICGWRWSASEWNDFFLDIRRRYFVADRYPAPAKGMRREAASWDWKTDYLVGDAGLNIRPSLDVLLRFADNHSQQRLSWLSRRLLTLRRAALVGGVRLRDTPGVGRFIASIPVAWQYQLRRWIVGQR